MGREPVGLGRGVQTGDDVKGCGHYIERCECGCNEWGVYLGYKTCGFFKTRREARQFIRAQRKRKGRKP